MVNMIVPLLLKKHSNVLISGCGGGFDFFCGSPIGLELEKRGHKVVYSSYSFSGLHNVISSNKIADTVTIVDEKSKMKDDELMSKYFPEKFFCEWYQRTYGVSTKVYCYQGVSIARLTEVFSLLYEIEKIDYHFVVDGGCDGVFRGDEYDFGSPSTDAISIIAANLSKSVIKKYYVMTAFGTEGYAKQVSHAQALNRVADITASGKTVIVSSITNDPELSKAFRSAFDYISKAMPIEFQSTIGGSIAFSLEGKFGDHAVNQKTRNAPIWVSPLTSLLWYLDLDAVAKNKLYYKEILAAKTSMGVTLAVEKFIKSRRRLERESIPI